VDRIRARLLAVSRAYNLDDAEVAVFPTMMLIETGHGETAQVHLSSQTGRSLRLDQVAELYEVLKDAEAGRLSPPDGLVRLDAVAAMTARVPWPIRLLGHASLSSPTGGPSNARDQAARWLGNERQPQGEDAMPEQAFGHGTRAVMAATASSRTRPSGVTGDRPRRLQHS